MTQLIFSSLALLSRISPAGDATRQRSCSLSPPPLTHCKNRTLTGIKSMKPFRKLSSMAKSQLLLFQSASPKPQSLLSPISKASSALRQIPLDSSLTQATSSSFCSNSSPAKKKIEKQTSNTRAAGIATEELSRAIADLAVELSDSSDLEALVAVLESKAKPLFRNYPDGSASIELLKQLKSSPQTALEVVLVIQSLPPFFLLCCCSRVRFLKSGVVWFFFGCVGLFMEEEAG